MCIISKSSLYIMNILNSKSKFKDRYFDLMVPEWRNGYLNYRYLK